MSSGPEPFNPLDKRHLGESVGAALLKQPAIPMSELRAFDGAGIYAIYYTGDFTAYERLARANAQEAFRAPIYVGKAVPKGARKGDAPEQSAGKVLFQRLVQHRKSLEAASNLDVADFRSRFLVVDDIWIPLGESLLIARFSPIWNCLIDGFGNHDPGKGRHAGLRPRWDVLHPGRPWAAKCRDREESSEQLIAEILEYLESIPLASES